VKGHLERYEQFASGWVESRTVDVWLPPGYETGPRRRYPVLYMHDGQNLFDGRLSFSGVAWGVNETVERMMRDGEIDGVIIVGIWNTPRRIQEYMPQKPLEWYGSVKRRKRFVQKYGGPPISDAYLRFIVYELKPFIDASYRTLERRPYTFMMGSSMGGLVTLYALCEYPEVFRGAACLSTSWTVGGRVMLPYLKECIPDPHTHVVYFDYGVEAHIGTYEHIQREVDALFIRAGYVRDVNLITERFPGAPHSEAAWRERVDVPLRFLLHPRVPRTAVSLR